jgi:cell division protein FtsI/penicillin-binding protein 2
MYFGIDFVLLQILTKGDIMNKKRLKTIGVVFSLCAVFLIIAESRICFLSGDKYTKSAVMQRTSEVVIKRHRGGFTDRNRIPIVEETAKSYLLDEDGHLTETDGLKLSPITVRYSEDSVAAHLVGYVNADGLGVSGLEKVFEDYLNTTDTSEVSVVKSANGKMIQNAGISSPKGTNRGDYVVLTIDSHIQKIAEDTLKKNGITGAAVVLDVESFDVLAMASSPTFDRNNVDKYLNSSKSELVNRCLSEYNAGSIFKIITLCSALERNALLDTYTCMGMTEIEGRTFNCHKWDGHGTIDTKTAFASSCNCAFYALGQRLGAESILDAARFFDLGKAQVSLSGFEEADGNLPQKTMYSPLDYVNYSIGQGEILLTPVQAASVACVIASGGNKKSINIADSLCSYDGEKKLVLRQNEERRVISEYCARYMQECMRLAVTDGTGKALADSKAKIAGKTGTAETGWVQNSKMLEHGWFCGYFPYDKPKYAMAVIAEGGGSGSVSAAPVFRDIAEEINKIYPIG